MGVEGGEVEGRVGNNVGGGASGVGFDAGNCMEGGSGGGGEGGGGGGVGGGGGGGGGEGGEENVGLRPPASLGNSTVI